MNRIEQFNEDLDRLVRHCELAIKALRIPAQYNVESIANALTDDVNIMKGNKHG